MNETLNTVLQALLRFFVHPIFENPLIVALVSGLILLIIGYLVNKKNHGDVKINKITRKGNGGTIITDIKGSTIEIDSPSQNHTGSGDNIGRDKVVNRTREEPSVGRNGNHSSANSFKR